MDHAVLVDALDHVWSSTSAVLHDAGDDIWERPTGCPGWTVRDQLSHMIWSADIWRGVAPDPIELPELAHVAGPVGAYMELAVHARRGREGAEVLAEFDASRAGAITDLRDRLPGGLDEPLAGPMGYEMPRAAFLEISVFDQWVHGVDIAAALGVEPDRRSGAAQHSQSQILAGWSAKAGDVRPVEVAVVGGPADPDLPHRLGIGEPVASIEIHFDDLVTRAAGRDRPVGSIEVRGDAPAAQAALDLSPVTP